MTRLTPPRMPFAYRPKWFGAVVPSSIPLSETSTAKPEAAADAGEPDRVEELRSGFVRRRIGHELNGVEVSAHHARPPRPARGPCQRMDPVVGGVGPFPLDELAQGADASEALLVAVDEIRVVRDVGHDLGAGAGEG